jgi:hypothetical protein
LHFEWGSARADREPLDADIIVVATGLELEQLGGTQLEVDGKPVHFSDTFTDKGTLNRMDEFGVRQVTPRLGGQEDGPQGAARERGADVRKPGRELEPIRSSANYLSRFF